MELSQLAEGLVRIVRGEQAYLGIATYISTNRFAVTKLTGMKRSEGTIAREGEVITWHVHGFTQHNNSLYLYGDYVEGHTLSEVLQYSAEGFLPYLSRLTRALGTLADHGRPTPLIHTRGIVFLEDGGVLFLPPDLLRSMTEFQSPEDRHEFYEAYRHPDLKEEQNVSYAIGVLAYQSLTGTRPFNEDDEEELTERARSGLVTNPRYLVPEISPEVADTLKKALSDPQSALPELPQWTEIFQSWIQHGTHREISDEERQEIIRYAEAERHGMERSYRRREYIRKNWRRYVGITLIAVLVGTIPATIIYRQLEPRSTAGLDPPGVIRAFYYGMNNLDHERMSDAVVDGAGRDTIREVTSMYVVSRMRTAMERRSNLIDARDWVSEGRPEISGGKSVYGVTDLQIERLRPPHEGEEAFRVTYNKWYPTGMEDDSAGSGSGAGAGSGEGTLIGFERRDRVLMRRSRNAWVIYEIERLQNETIERRNIDGTPRESSDQQRIEQ